MKKIKNREFLSELSPSMKKILDSELAAGNRIKEISRAKFTANNSSFLYVFLEKEFRTKTGFDMTGIKYNEVNDRHYWKADFLDAENCQVIACGFDD